MKPMAPMEPFAPADGGDAWWPKGLGAPSATGAQDGLRYAVFPEARRLAVEHGGRVAVYDIGEHRIAGVAQADGGAVRFAEAGGGAVALDSLDEAG